MCVRPAEEDIRGKSGYGPSVYLHEMGGWSQEATSGATLPAGTLVISL